MYEQNRNVEKCIPVLRAVGAAPPPPAKLGLKKSIKWDALDALDVETLGGNIPTPLHPPFVKGHCSIQR
jgi:hypothetical protein